jgi:hypothetical protein
MTKTQHQAAAGNGPQRVSFRCVVRGVRGSHLTRPNVLVLPSLSPTAAAAAAAVLAVYGGALVSAYGAWLASPAGRGGEGCLGYRGRLCAPQTPPIPRSQPEPARGEEGRQDTRLRGSSTCLRTATAWIRGGGGGCVAAAGPNSVLGRLVQRSAGVTSAAPRPGRFHFLAGGCGFHLTGVLGG